MAIKINGIDVIDNNYLITSAVGSITSGEYYQCHPNISSTSGSGTINLDLDSSLMFVTLTGNATINLSDSTRGNLSQIILTTDGFTPTFNGTDFYFSGGVDPTWGDFEIWKLNCVGLSSGGTCAVSATGYTEGATAGATTIPTGSGAGVNETVTGRLASAGEVAYSDSISYQFAGPTSSSASITFRFLRDVNSFKIQVKGDGSGSVSTDVKWFDTSGTSSNLTSTYVTIYENSVATPSAIKAAWVEDTNESVGITKTYTSGSYNNGDWSATPSSGVEIVAKAEVLAQSDDGTNESLPYLATDSINFQVEFWGRSAGFDDTLLATFKATPSAESESDDF